MSEKPEEQQRRLVKWIREQNGSIGAELQVEQIYQLARIAAALEKIAHEGLWISPLPETPTVPTFDSAREG